MACPPEICGLDMTIDATIFRRPTVDSRRPINRRRRTVETLSQQRHTRKDNAAQQPAQAASKRKQTANACVQPAHQPSRTARRTHVRLLPALTRQGLFMSASIRGQLRRIAISSRGRWIVAAATRGSQYRQDCPDSNSHAHVAPQSQSIPPRTEARSIHRWSNLRRAAVLRGRAEESRRISRVKSTRQRTSNRRRSRRVDRYSDRRI